MNFSSVPVFLIDPRVVALVLLVTGANAATALPPDRVLLDTSGNLLANGDFRARDPEQRPLRWVEGPGPQTAIVITKEHHGAEKDDSSLMLAGALTNGPVWVRSEKHIASPGVQYTAHAWAKTGRGAPADLTLEFWNQAGVIIGRASKTPASTGGWQPVEVSLIAPDQVTHVSISIHSATNSTGVSYWDDVTLEPQVTYEPQMTAHVRELFLDDYRLASLVKVQRVVHPGEKSAPLINATESWERRAVYVYGTVLKDEPPGSGYRMWYTTFNDGYYLCYATSTDGLHWVKPHLGIVDFRGSTANNITLRGGGSLVYDPDDTDASRRYKLMTYDATPADKRGYAVYFSPDGLHWTPYAKNPVISYGDVCQVAYDRPRHLFIATSKQRMLIANTSVTPNKQDRSAFVSVSTNFTDWHAPDAPGSAWSLGVEGDPADDLRVMSEGGLEAQIYGMPVYPNEGIYIGLPWVFNIMNYTAGIYAAPGDGPIQPEIAVSRDLRLWSRPARDPILPLGREGAWDCGTIYTASSMLVSSNEMEIYYGAMNLAHGGDTAGQMQTARIARATWRRDGFVSLSNAGDDPGTITTKPIMVDHVTQLHVNAQLAPGGSLQAEILDADGKRLAGFDGAQSQPLTGDQLAGTLHWNGVNDLSSLAGKPVQLRFLLKGGDLYSYWFD